MITSVHDIEAVTRQRQRRYLHEGSAGKFGCYQQVATDGNALPGNGGFDGMEFLSKVQADKPR